MDQPNKRIVLTLDIDGVLNCYSSPCWKHDKFPLDPVFVKNYLELIDKYRDNLKIVLSSSWRLYPDRKLELIDSGILFEDCIGLPRLTSSRYNDINTYLIENNIKDFIAVDDDRSITSFPRDSYLLTDWYVGLDKDKTKELENLIKRKLK